VFDSLEDINFDVTPKVWVDGYELPIYFQKNGDINRLLNLFVGLQANFEDCSIKDLSQASSDYELIDGKSTQNVIVISQSIENLKRRLNYFGLDKAEVLEDFNRQVKRVISSFLETSSLEYKEIAYPVFGAFETTAETFHFIKNVSFDDIIDSLNRVLTNKYRKQLIHTNLGSIDGKTFAQCYGFPSHVDKGIDRYLIDNWFTGLFSESIFLLRAICESLDSEKEIKLVFQYDLNGAIDKSVYKEILETRINENPLLRQALIITEGPSDIHYLKESLNTLYSSLVPYFKFYEFPQQ